MTVNRLTDELLVKMVNLGNLIPTEQSEMAQELLELRKENEKLRKRVEVGEELYELSTLMNVNCNDFHHDKKKQHLFESDCPLVKQFNNIGEKWRESGGG